MTFEPLFAGMPALLPLDSGPRSLGESGVDVFAFVEILVYSTIVLSISAAFVRWSWNMIVEDSAALPRLTYPRAFGVCVIWGLAMFVALILIDGTRHSLTPTRWIRNGMTYQLSSDAEREIQVAREKRVAHLHQLDAALIRYSLDHDGFLPPSLEALGEADLTVPGTGGLAYVYSLKEDNNFRLLEPEWDEVRYALTPNGKVVEWPSE